VVFIGALLFSTPADAADVLHLVRDDDLADPAAAVVVAAVRTLVDAGKPAGPQLILDELRRTGTLRENVAGVLREATTAGACSQAARHYAAAVVAEALRRRVESAGYALSTAADTAAEAELAPMVAGAAAAVADCAHRLEALRGEPL
jgi:replicative DNA helicase